MSKLSNEILLVLAYVSLITDPDSVRSRFIESLNALDDAFAFKFVDRLPPGLPENRVLPIATLRSSFGFAVMAEGPGTTETERVVLRNAFQFLAVLLENRMQAHVLEATNISLLKESENKYRLLADNVSDVIFILDMNLNYTYISPSVKILRGYEPEEALKQSAVETLAPSSWNLAMGLLSEVIELEKSEQREILLSRTLQLEMNRKDGTTVWTEVKFSFIRDEDQRPVAILGVTRDITTRRKAEEDLKRTNIFLDSIIENIPNMVFLKDGKDLRFLRLNRAGEELLGYSRNDLLGKNDYDFFPKEQADDFVGNDRNVLHGKNILDIPEEHIQTRNKGERLLHTKKVPLLNSQGEPEYLLVISEDITERKRAENERAKLQDQLLQSQKMESVGRLAGGVAHDFNNMLGVILGHVEMAIDKAETGQPLLVDLHEIRKAADRSADLTNQLLAFARKQTVAPKVLDLNETVAGMLKLLHRLIGEDIHLVWLPDRELLPVKIDPSQIDQILANLCVNARDAIAGVGKVTIETGNISFDEVYCSDHMGFVPGEFILLAVSDDGCGMDKETLSHLFEPFFTTKELGKGTGLGLATIYGIVKQNNGFINVYSEPEQGTTFNIYLPRHIGKAEQTRSEGRQEPVMRGQETVLVVEDEPAILNLCRLMLEKQGYQVLTAGTPGEAIRLAKEHTGEIHLLMTDVVMPEMNGRDLAKNILSLYTNLKRVFMSGYTANVIAHHGVLDDGVYFIQKPFSRKDLAAKVREALDQE